MVNMFFRLTFSNIQCLSQAFELEQSERAVQVQVLEDGPMAINLSQQVALMLCVLICIARWHGDREPACQCRRHKRRRVDPWVGEIAWSRKWQPPPVFLPGEPHGQRNLAGYSPWHCRGSDVTKRTHTHCVVIDLQDSLFVSVCFISVFPSELWWWVVGFLILDS